ncbi:MAG: winged helix-turn-helix transcriptional regulator [Flavobacteriales bacterium]|nr:winged helix-turn-helix transcriptional regulator [Flavobacteriales bacterium]
MGLTKSNLFSKKHNRLADIAKVLGHPARIAILDHLIRQDACICTDLSEKIGLAQATVSQHLKELRRTGLIKGNIEGVARCYCIDKAKWKETAQYIAHFFSINTVSDECC